VRLIIADDQEVYREGLKSLLADFEWVDIIGEAEGDAALLELVESVAADVVLLDPGISDGTGIQVIERMRELVPELHVIIVTRLDDTHMRTAIESGVDGLLLRTIGSDELATALRLVADGHHYI
jgi:DNA-binding NarL/FixJ family response regulator